MPQDGASDTSAAQAQVTALLDAAPMHVLFEGWSDAALRAAAMDADVPIAVARALFPRSGIDLAVAHHKRGDAQLAAQLAAGDLSNMKIRERIAHAVKTRIEGAGGQDIVRAASVLFALPQHSAEGARLIWGTADTIWTALGDPSDDFNWYSKRAVLSAVYSATLLYWFGDQSEDSQETWDFLDRRIENVMQFEKTKAQIRNNDTLMSVLKGPLSILDAVKAPQASGQNPSGPFGGWMGDAP
ncbi:MAG: COQ9 family protein [Paracoccaceae bacterium]|jgi:ubiquinone biosynthesis protein COQ9